jgi:TP901 family phage tail tape measure protein
VATVAGVALVEVKYDPTSIAKLRSQTAATGQQLASSWQKTADSFKRVGASLTRHVTLPLVAVGAVSVKVAADFDASLSKIQGLVGASSEQMAQYRKSILALAPAVAQGPTALADALYFVTSSGFKGAEALKILTVSAKASTAGLGDTQTVADLLTSAMTAYGTKALSAAKATDILVAATKAGKGDPAEFAAALQINVAAANTLGVSFGQLAAATAALSTVNSNVSEDATQLSGIFQAIIKPGPEAIKTLKGVGLSLAGLRTEVKDKGLLSTLLDLKDRFHGNVTEMGKLFPNVRGLRGFLTLVGAAAKRNVSIFDQVAHSTGDLNKAFQTALTQNPQVQYQKLTAQLQVLAIIIGEQLIPVALKFAGWLTTLANKFKGLSTGQQTFVLIAAGVAAAIGPVLSLVGNILTLVRVLRIVTAVQWLFNAALDANPIGLIVLGLAALTVAFVVAYKKSATFRAVVHAALHAVAVAVDFVRAHWRQLLVVIPVIGPLLAVVATHFSTAKQIAVAAFNAIKVAVGAVVGDIKTLIRYAKRIYDAFSAGLSGITGLFGPVVSFIDSLVSKVETLASAISSLGGGSAHPAGTHAGVGGGHGGTAPHHALGGIFTAPTLVGNDLFGEAGREAVVPLDTPYGHRMLAQALRDAGVGGGDTYVEIDGRVLTERVDYRVRRWERGIARQLDSGDKWGGR